MPISYFDLGLLIFIGGFGLFGLWFGLVRTLGSLLGAILGLYLAVRFYEPVAYWLMNITGWKENVSRVLIFIIAFFIINRLVSLVFWLAEKLLSVITSLPFINSINRMLGLLFGILEGALVAGIIFYFMSKFPVWPKLMTWLAESKVAPYTVKLASTLWPLIPEALKTLQNSIPWIK